MIKSSNEQTIRQVIQELLDAYRLHDGIKGTKLVHAWDKIAGEFIAGHTEDIYIKKNILYVRINSPALKNELSFAKSKLIESLNNAVEGATLKDIVFL